MISAENLINTKLRKINHAATGYSICDNLNNLLHSVGFNIPNSCSYIFDFIHACTPSQHNHAVELTQLPNTPALCGQAEPGPTRLLPNHLGLPQTNELGQCTLTSRYRPSTHQ